MRERRRWNRGDVITYSEEKDGRLWCEIPVTVIDDDGSRLSFRIQVGAEWRAAFTRDGQRAHTWEMDWEVRPVLWVDDDCTYLVSEGDHYGLAYCSPASDSGVSKFYVNIQEPLSWTDRGFESLDLELDLVLHRDDQAARWKDLPMFNQLALHTQMTPKRKAELLCQARRARELIESPTVQAELLNLAGIELPPRVRLGA